MLAFELSTAVPCGSAPYYSLVVRDPYILGNHPSADILICDDGISEQHVSLTVLHAHEAERELAAAAAMQAATAAATHYEDGDEEAPEEHSPPSAGGEEEEEADAEPPAAEEKEEEEASGSAADNGEDAVKEESAAEKEKEANDEEEEEEEGEVNDDAHAVADEAEEVRAPAAPTPNPTAATDRLVVRVTALPSKGAGEVRIGSVCLQPGDSVIVRDGDVLHLGEGIKGTFRYRPLLVGLEAGSYPDDYVSDLRRMFDQLGATFVEEPVPSADMPHLPIGHLYCAEELNDSTGCLAALAYGYSVVQPTYVFEWFAAVSRRAAAPLSSLLPPVRFEVPVRCTTHPTTTTYLRPESDSCPFSLFPIPNTAMTNRSRAELFAGRVFFFFTDAAATRYWRAVEDCGGAVYGPGDVEAAREAVRRLVEAQREAGSSAHRLPDNFYVVLDNTSEAVLLNSGLEAASPELLAFLNEIGSDYGAANVCVMGDHSLFTALLSNHFYEEPVPLTAGVPVVAETGYNDPADDYHGEDGNVDVYAEAGAAAGAPPVSVRTPRSTYSPRMRSVGGADHPTSARSGSRVSVTRASERRNSLLPRTADRTPSRSQMRSYSRQRARSASMQQPNGNGGQSVATGYENGSYYAGSTSARSGRRRLVPSVIEGELRSFAEDFDLTRVRIYAFLVREEPRLDKAIATYHRNFYVNTDAMEYALEVKAQAEEFMERVDDLLADPACHGAYTESLRRFWRDCSDMDVKAQHLLHCWDRSFPAAALPRRSRSRRASSVAATTSRRAPSSRSVTPRGVVSMSNTPAKGDYEGSPEEQQQHSQGEAQSPAGAAAPPPQLAAGHARAYSASSRQSHRRSVTPRAQPRSQAPPPVPIEERPAWVSTWAEPSEAEESEQPPKPSKTPKASKASGAKTPRPVRNAAAETEVAKYAPAVVRARSTGRSASRPRRAAPPTAHDDLHATVLSDQSVKFTVEEGASATQRLVGAEDTIRFHEEEPQELTEGTVNYHEEPITQELTEGTVNYHEEEGDHTQDLTEGTVNYREEPATHAAQVGESDDEDPEESQVRTAPAPTPQPAPPAAQPRKAAATSKPKTQAKTKGAPKQQKKKTKNGGAVNGQASQRKAKASAKPEKPRASPRWNY